MMNPRGHDVPVLLRTAWATVSWVALAALLFFFGSAIAAETPVPSTEIHDSILLDDTVCTISIVGGNQDVCQGTVVLSASLTCGPFYQRVRDPQWFLDGAPVGQGDQITLSPSVGSHVVLVSCGSCEDSITLSVLSCANEPMLNAAFSCDSTEDTAGIFMQPNIAQVTPLDFQQIKFLMRPFTLAADSSVHTGAYDLTETGDPIVDLYQPTGQRLTLPAHIPVSSLPLTLLANATGVGDVRVRATFDTTGIGGVPAYDEVRIRVGRFAGLTGKPLPRFPWFLHTESINDNDTLRTALDPMLHAERIGLPYRAYVVAHKTPAQWVADPTLVDVTGGYKVGRVAAGGIQDNVITAWSYGLDGGNNVSKAYDVVYDFGMDGRLDPGDLIDALTYDGVGFSVVRDLNLPGPYTSTQVDYSGGSWLGERAYYPAEIATLGVLPLAIISHGNGHDYRWYDYLGQHLASHGYVVMSHQNNTGPGIESAAATTLSNTDYFLGHLDSIAGGVLQGHVDGHRITWIGHSRGGEGVVRAYDEIVDGEYTPVYFTAADIILVCGIAPTVFEGANMSDPHTVTYHLIGAGADGDVTGQPDCDICQYFRISDRDRGTVQTLYVHGAAHNDFNCCGYADGTGPDQIGRAAAQIVAKSYYLALLELYTKKNPAGKDFLTRLYNEFHPSGIAPNVTCATSYRELNTPANFIIDDFQTNPETWVSSSGGTVTSTVSHLYEGMNNDADSTFTWKSSDPMNGMILAAGNGDFSKGTVFDYTIGDDRSLEWQVVPGQQDFRTFSCVSFRACQGTRHPETVGLNGYNSFSVTLRDVHGVSSSVDFGAWGGLSPLYPRTGSGDGAGWVNEMNTVRIDLSSFTANGSGLDLSDIVAVRLEFGAAHGSPRGRIGLDDLQIMAH